MNTTIKYFKEITKIYRESKHEEKIVKYLIDFDKKRNLQYIKDKYNNILITKTSSDKAPVILQAHLDMVYVSNNDFDFKNKEIPIKINKKYIYTDGTTLGADDGIGIALILTMLDKTKANIEALFTASEEIDMNGAKKFDGSLLKGKYLINLDGFNKNIIINDTAAFYDIEINKKIGKKKSKYHNTYKIEISGLPGGHSGADIVKKDNAIIILGKILNKLNVELISFKGGTKNNVIPSSAISYFNSDDDININKKNIKLEKVKYQDIVISNTKEYLESILNLPKNIYYKDDLVVTSYNLGVINDNLFQIGLRSNNLKKANILINRIKNNGEEYNYQMQIKDFEPSFHTRRYSKLIKVLQECNRKAVIKMSHITVEVGFLQNKRKDLEIAIIAPEIEFAHSINERVNIKSIIDTEKWLQKAIEKLSN